MFRWTFHILALLSLILMIATCVAWIRSFTRTEGFRSNNPDGGLFAGYNDGQWEIYILSFSTANGSTSSFEWYSKRDGSLFPVPQALDSVQVSFSFIGFEYGNEGDDWTPGVSLVHVKVPPWAVTSIFSILPFVWMLGRRGRLRSARIRKGLCRTCGYDMTGSFDVCPECGAVQK